MRFRDYKNFRLNGIYHVFNRGVDKNSIFNHRDDYFAFLKRMSIVLSKTSVYGNRTLIRPFPAGSFSVLAYCLMTNHYHFIIRQNTEIPIGKLIQKVCTSYSIYFNKKYQRVGHLFQDVFKAKIVENDKYLIKLSAYIHLNPGVKSMDYQYSSIGEYFNLKNDGICEPDFILSHFKGSRKSYLKFLQGQPLEVAPVNVDEIDGENFGF